MKKKLSAKEAKKIVIALMLTPNGREEAKKLGLEKIFEREIQKLKRKLPLVNFRERAALGFDNLAKQPPVTLEEARAQVLWLRGDFPNKEEALKFVRTLTNKEYVNYIKGTIKD